MPDQPMDDPRIWEMIEACRSGSGDLDDPALAPLVEQLAAHPELADVVERLQRLDVTLAAAFQDVPLPDGLELRITTRLAGVRNGRKAGAVEPPVAEQEVRQPEGREPVAEATRPRRRVARGWLVAGGTVAAVAASVALAVVFLNGPPPVLDGNDVLEAAKIAFDDDRSAEGQLLVERDPPKEYPLGRDVDVSRVPSNQVRWRRISGFLGCRGVAYDFGPSRARRATLYVVRGTVPDLGTTAPQRPTSETGGQCIGTWQSGDLLYVLVVQGGPRTYQSLLRPPGPMA